MPLDSKRINGPENTISPTVFMESKPFIKPVNERSDNRKMLDCRNPILRVGIIKEARGSAYMEIGKTKIICSVYGPREVPKLQSFQNKGQLFCEVRFAPFSQRQYNNRQSANQEKEFSSVLKEAIEPVICLYKFPKCTIDIFVLVLEDDGSVLSNSITCAGAALMDAGIDMYDLVIGCSLRQWDELCILDPTSDEEFVKNDSNVKINNGNVTVAFMPSLKQVAALHLQGELEVPVVNNSLKILMDGCWHIYPVIQNCLIQALKYQLK